MQNTQKTNLLRAMVFHSIITAFQKTSQTEEILKTIESEKAKNDFSRIRCPLCKWQPNSSSRWFCADCDFPEYFYGGCWTSWNTFETRGVCPGCKHRWRYTSCLRCGVFSLHEDWYEKDED